MAMWIKSILALTALIVGIERLSTALGKPLLIIAQNQALLLASGIILLWAAWLLNPFTIKRRMI